MKTLTHTKPKISSLNGEDVNLANILLNGRKLPFGERINMFNQLVGNLKGTQRHLYFRSVVSQADRIVTIIDYNGQHKKMLMFGSNNYLGLANHPYVLKYVKKAIEKFGVGIGGPPLLNGYSKLMKELEERLSALKGTEETLIFSSGYNANVGLVTGLCTPSDIILADEYSHASFFDGVKMLRGKCNSFRHNHVEGLNSLFEKYSSTCDGNIFVAIEGVYSMDGDIAPLDKIIPLCRKYNAILLVDDAHGTGVLGVKGGGVHDHFNMPADKDIILGTFSKTFAVNGGFISAPKPIIHYLRFLSRPYMFSASLPPVTIAAVLAGLDVLENEPHLRKQLYENVKYVTHKLRKFGLASEPQSGIIALKVPDKANIRKLANQFHDAGIFLNAIEFPAVPLSKQRFRISIMANHTKKDLDKLVATVEEIWNKNIDPSENLKIN